MSAVPFRAAGRRRGEAAPAVGGTGPLHRLARRGVTATAGVVVVAGVVAELVRPLAPSVEPVDALRHFDAAYLARAAAYRAPTYPAALAALLLRVGVVAAIAWSPPGRRAVEAVVRRVGDPRPALAAAAVGVGAVAAADLAGLPLDVWRGYVHEGVWGLRTQGAGGFARDWVVAVVPGWLAVAVLLAGGSVLVRRLPRTWPAVGGLAAAGLAALVVGVGPVVLEPLQVRTTPLADGPVRAAVEEVLERAGARVDVILVADASRRSTRENAYVSGLGGTRRVVLYDTLVANRSPAEVGMVLAHELGHDAHGDIGRSTLLAGAGAVLTAGVLGLVLRRRAARGLQDGPADPRGAAVAVAVVTLLGVLSLPVQSWVSRRAEAAADLAALRLTDDPETFLALQRNLTRANLGNPRPPGWVVLLWGTHPSPTQRLALGEHYADLRRAAEPPAAERPTP